MNCCNANGDCTQGKDCPVRKQRIKEINDAYVNGYNDAKFACAFFEDIAYTVKGVIIVIAVAVPSLLAFALWGK